MSRPTWPRYMTFFSKSCFVDVCYHFFFNSAIFFSPLLLPPPLPSQLANVLEIDLDLVKVSTTSKCKVCMD